MTQICVGEWGRVPKNTLDPPTNHQLSVGAVTDCARNPLNGQKTELLSWLAMRTWHRPTKLIIILLEGGHLLDGEPADGRLQLEGGGEHLGAVVLVVVLVVLVVLVG